MRVKTPELRLLKGGEAVGQKPPQSSPCLMCQANVTPPKDPPGGWWLALQNSWVNPPNMSVSEVASPGTEPQISYLVKVKANGYTLKSILPFLCFECQERLKHEARKVWGCAAE